MKENYSVLFLGKIYDNHMVRFVRNLKYVNPNIKIDCFGPCIKGREMPSGYKSLFDDCKIVSFSSCLKKIPGLRSIEDIINWHKSFGDFAKSRKYDIVNIHYPSYIYKYILKDLKRLTDNIILTPWGSDVYRINAHQQRLLQKLYNEAKYVTGSGDRFTKDFMRIFNVPQEKFIRADIGSETIDYIINHEKQCKSEEAKRFLGIENHYAITCGYNAAEAQQHIKIIEAIARVKEKLPQNLILLFPVTYPQKHNYIESLKSIVNNLGIEALFFEHYLDLDKLFILQQATDMFIHVQTTDANSTSIKEYLLLDKNCINGSWMKYDDIEDDNYKPYHTVDNIEHLDEALIEAIRLGTPAITDKIKNRIKDLGCLRAAQRWNSIFSSINE